MEYPPGALAVFLPPAAFGSSHYNAAFKALMALCGLATLVLLAWLLVRSGSLDEAPYRCGAAVRPVADRARADLPQHLRRVARASDRGRAGAVRRRPKHGGIRAPRRRLRGKGLPRRPASAGADLRLADGRPSARVARARSLRGRRDALHRSVPRSRATRVGGELSCAGRALAAGREPRRLAARRGRPARGLRRHRRPPNGPCHLV